MQIHIGAHTVLTTTASVPEFATETRSRSCSPPPGAGRGTRDAGRGWDYGESSRHEDVRCRWTGPGRDRGTQLGSVIYSRSLLGPSSWPLQADPYLICH